MSRLKNISKDIENEDKKKSKKKLKRFIIVILLTDIVLFAVKSAFSIHKWQSLATQMIANSPSQVLDTDGNVIAEIGSERNRKNVELSQIPQNLKDAYVAIEDERFYKHFGIDVKRTTAAIGSYVIHLGNASFGASTITQQLVKNLTGDDTNSIFRKVKEWSKAIELEWCMDKDEILESYLNIIYVGPNIYGVEMGANYYFGKSVSELDLAECAFLAGINNAPNSYNPFNEAKDNSEKIKKRTKTVLGKMLELENITEDEYNQAMEKVEAGFKFKKGKIQPDGDGIYSYHTDSVLSELISDIAKNKKISKTFATNYLYMANAKVYSTQDSTIQKQIETEFAKSKYILKSDDGKDTSQAAMVLIDHKTGYVLGCVGGLGKKAEARGFNRATQAVRQTGSSSKPLAVIIPALDKKIITPVSTYKDEATTFIDNNNEEYSPTDYNNYLGEITVRRAVESSQNIPFVKIMEELTPAISIKYLKSMGISTLNEKDENLALALGGLDKGISPLEMAGAYSTIANDGVYIEPTFYTKITAQNGKIIAKSKQSQRRVFSKEVAYITKELLTQPVVGKNGTAIYCSIAGMDVAAKTGTTNEDYDRWLCGFTNYYTAVTWFGYDLSERINYNGKNPAGIIWASVMNSIHKKLENSKFEQASGVVAKIICKDSLKAANSGCTSTYTEYFIKGTVPQTCTIHKGSIIPDDITIDESTTQKIKDVVKSTVKEVTEDIGSQLEDSTTPQSSVEQEIKEMQQIPVNPEPEAVQPQEDPQVDSTNNNDISENEITQPPQTTTDVEETTTTQEAIPATQEEPMVPENNDDNSDETNNENDN